MEACHWKAHNTFTNFYLKDLRQQYVSGSSSGGSTSPRPFPSDQLSSERKEGGRGGHICYKQVFRSLIPGSRYRFTSQDIMGNLLCGCSTT